MKPLFAFVTVDIPSLKEPLTFAQNGFSVKTGDVVAVQINKSYKAGIVTGIASAGYKLPEKISEAKPILQVIAQNVITDKQVVLAKEIASYYCCPLIEAVKLFMPAGLSLKLEQSGEDGNVSFHFSKPPVKEKSVTFVAFKKLPEKPTEKQKTVIDCLKERGETAKSSLREITGVSSQVISNMNKKGYVSFNEKKVSRLPDEHFKEEYKRPLLNRNQEKALLAVKPAIEKDQKKIFVLLGVTASGKTEVYLRCIEECLSLGKTAIYLLPEISLTPQIISRLKSRFGSKVAVLHSNMSAGERFDQFTGIKEGKYKIAVGPRSALFAPLEKLGLIILDEEQESSYKQNRSPRYDARNVALMRAGIESCCIIYGSATPSVETLYKATQGDYKLLKLPDRAVGKQAEVKLVDLSKEPNRDNCLSRYLNRKIGQMAENQKAVIFLNRRGFSGFLICRNCGHVPTCTNCDVSMTLHGKYLLCHYCNKIIPFDTKCRKCGSSLNKFLSAGTQRIEWELKLKHPHLKTIRMDADTTSAKGGHGKKLAYFRESGKAALIGTQMIAKGIDFPDVCLVGAVNTDVGLNMPDFRASERVFQTLYQLAGRAGRGSMPSEVVLQTFDAESKMVKELLELDYAKFYNHEIKRREELDYPPFSKLINIGIRGKDKTKVKEVGQKIAGKIKAAGVEGIKAVLGPSAAPISYIKKSYRWHILIKAEKDFNGQLILCKAIESCRRKDVVIAIDVDPVSMV